MEEGQPIEKGTIVASRSAPESAIGYVNEVLDEETVEIILYKDEMPVECPIEDVVASPQWYVAAEWECSRDKACNVRMSPTMDSEKIGTRSDGDRELISHEVDGFLRIQNVGWVRKKGNYTGAWVPGDTDSRESTPTPKSAVSNNSLGKLVRKNEHEMAVAEKARLMKKAFLEGVSVDEALERVQHHLNSPHRDRESAISSVSYSSPRVGMYNEQSIPSSLRTPSSLSSPTSPASRGARVRIMEPVDPPPPEPLSPGPTPGWTSGGKTVTTCVTTSGGYTKMRTSCGGKAKVKKPGPVLPPPPPPPSPKYHIDTLLQEWLNQYHLNPYAHIFSQHEVDIVVLPTLTYGDLVEMRLPPNVCRAIIHAIRYPDDKPLLERPRRQRSPTRRARFSA
eukprot:TRINITY_DN5351_c0_g1_i1.p1 TRINITY_DN5351_c0_g1~~TRINITY_DN5351_c0_g1_i1.p1  ORF type:complete len:411 (+),score=105.60 TRINITY_DN5351_c0_g1_i1:56-1234(+)